MWPAEFYMRPSWRRTGNLYFPAAALVDGQWRVLRINSFPDHPMWTLFIGGVVRGDIDDLPSNWGSPCDPIPQLEPQAAQVALEPIHSFDVYGSEVGRPCDGDFCCARADRDGGSR